MLLLRLGFGLFYEPLPLSQKMVSSVCFGEIVRGKGRRGLAAGRTENPSHHVSRLKPAEQDLQETVHLSLKIAISKHIAPKRYREVLRQMTVK